MADTPQNPPAPPAPPRRKAATGARKSTRPTPAKPKSAAKAKPAAAADETPTAPAAKAPAPRAAPARKPAAAKSKPRVRTPDSSIADSATKKAGKAAKRVADTTSTTRRAVAQSAPLRQVGKTRDRMGDRNFFAAIIGGVAALGAAVGGLYYALRDGHPNTPGGDDTPQPSGNDTPS